MWFRPSLLKRPPLPLHQLCQQISADAFSLTVPWFEHSGAKVCGRERWTTYESLVCEPQRVQDDGMMTVPNVGFVLWHSPLWYEIYITWKAGVNAFLLNVNALRGLGNWSLIETFTEIILKTSVSNGSGLWCMVLINLKQNEQAILNITGQAKIFNHNVYFDIWLALWFCGQSITSQASIRVQNNCAI